jgi:hypothetical protein
MDYSKVNKMLDNLLALRNQKPYQKDVLKEIKNPDGEQGEEGLTYEFYEVKGEENLFIRLTITTDSYGDNESIQGVQFVRPKEKTVTVFETI